MKFLKHFSTRRTPQSQPIPGKSMVANNAGGYAFPVDDWARLQRFLILSSEGGTYYVGERTLTRENAEAVLRCIHEDGPGVVERIVAVSAAGRAPKNDAALFALAMCAGLGDLPTRQAALAALPQVARTGAHLFAFVAYVEGFRGWGRGLRAAVRRWYDEMPAGKLAYQVVKYQQRNGWSHRDLLRLAKPVPQDDSHNLVYGYVAGKRAAESAEIVADGDTRLLWVYERMKAAQSEAEVAQLIREQKLTWEFVPANWLGSAHVWRALLPNLPYTAGLRNLGRMTANGALQTMTPEVDALCERLADPAAIRAARQHPVNILAAALTYAQGKGMAGSLTWKPLREVVDALDAAFYAAFENVRPTGKRIVLGIDVSGSMRGMRVNGMPYLPAFEACAVMAMALARGERSYTTVAFDTHAHPLSISPRQRLEEIVGVVSKTGGGGTDCAVPIRYALENKIAADAFVILTDSETWFGTQHPAQAIQEYRRAMGIPAMLVTVAMAANHVSLSDADDALMMNVVGFDTAAPQLIRDFVAGELSAEGAIGTGTGDGADSPNDLSEE